jgi:hypothetical protein
VDDDDDNEPEQDPQEEQGACGQMKSFFNTSNKNFFKLIPDDNTNTNINECDTNNDPYGVNNLNEIN